MPDDEEMPNTPGVLGDGILQDGRDPGAARRTVIRDANARRQQDEVARAVQRGQDRRMPQTRTPQGGAGPMRARRGPAEMHREGLARLLAALTRGNELPKINPLA